MTPSQATQAARMVHAVDEIETFLSGDHDKLSMGSSGMSFFAGYGQRPGYQATFTLPIDTAKESLRLMATTLRAQLADLGVE